MITYSGKIKVIKARSRSKRLREIGGTASTVASSREVVAAPSVDLSRYVLKATFDDLFEKVNLGTDAAPKWAIKAKYNFYTVGWLSFRGANDGSGGSAVAGAANLSDLKDVSLGSLVAGQALVWNGAKWVNSTIATSGLDEASLANYLSSHGYATQSWVTGAFVSKSGDTMTGHLTLLAHDVYLKNSTDGSQYVCYGFKNTINAIIAQIGYHNTAKRVIINPVGSSEPWVDAVGKYNLIIGNNELKYNTHSLLHTGNYTATLDERYLKLTGGTVTGLLKISFAASTPFTVNNPVVNKECGIAFSLSNTGKGWVGYNPILGAVLYNYANSKYLGIKDDGTPHYQGYTLWHSGNDGHNSGLDADTVDGVQCSDILHFAVLQPQNLDANSIVTTGSCYVPRGDMNNSSWNGYTFTNFPTSKPQGGFMLMNLAEGNYRRQLYAAYNNPNLYVRYYYFNGTATTWSPWHTLAFTDSTVANANSLGGIAAGDYVTRNGDQKIGGVKTFTNCTKIEQALMFKGAPDGVYFATSANGNLNISAHTNYLWVKNIGYIRPSGSLTMGSFIKSGGTAAQFLKADGSVDSRAFLVLDGQQESTGASLDLNAFNTAVFTRIRTGEQTTTNCPFAGYGQLLNLWTTGKVSALQIVSKSSDIYFRSKDGASATITSNWHRILHSDNYSSILDDRYVNASGDTMTGPLAVREIDAPDGNGLLAYSGSWTGVDFSSQYGVGTINRQGVIRSGNASLIHYRHGAGNATIWDSLNDGHGSGLDADTVDGVHASSFLYYKGALSSATTAIAGVGLYGWNTAASSNFNGFGHGYGDSIVFQGHTTWYNRLDFNTNGNIDFWHAINPSSLTGSMSKVGTLAFLHSTVANANSLGGKAAAQYVTIDTVQEITGRKTIRGASLKLLGGSTSNAANRHSAGVLAFQEHAYDDQFGIWGYFGGTGASQKLFIGGSGAGTSLANDQNGTTLTPYLTIEHTTGNLTVLGKIIKSGGTDVQLLRADGGVATFNWAGRSGQPTWLWGGNTWQTYYVYNPSNFNVNSAAYLRDRTNGIATYLNYGAAGITTTAWLAAWHDYELRTISPANVLTTINALSRNGGSMTNTNVVTNLNADLLDGLHLDSVRGYRVEHPAINSSLAVGNVPFNALGMQHGTPIYNDPEFASGNNAVAVYNNAANGNVTITRIADNQASANSSGYILQIKVTGLAEPWTGGFVQSIQSRANAVFMQIFRAKIPVGYNVVANSNQMGANYSDVWITSTAGTGKWEWYARVVYCGASGSFSRGGYVSLKGANATAANPLYWYLSHCQAWDLSKNNYGTLRAKFADALSASRSIWGQNFDGTANVSGNMTGVGTITSTYYSLHNISNNPYLKFNVDGKNTYVQALSTGISVGPTYIALFVTNDSKVGIGTASPSEKLSVAGWVGTIGNTGWYNITHGGGWYMSDATWVRTYNNKGIYSGTGEIRNNSYFNRTAYEGSSWNNGYGAYNVSIFSNLSQTPLMVAYRNGYAVDVTGANRLFALELLNSGAEMHFAFGGSTKFSMTNTGKFFADGGIWTNGYMSFRGQNTSSDARQKRILRDIHVPLTTIAKAPNIVFSWLDNGKLDMGSIAQYWQKYLPLSVYVRPNGYLGMDYSKVALACVISMASEILGVKGDVSMLKRELRQLKHENQQLKQQIDRMERRIA